MFAFKVHMSKIFKISKEIKTFANLKKKAHTFFLLTEITSNFLVEFIESHSLLVDFEENRRTFGVTGL